MSKNLVAPGHAPATVVAVATVLSLALMPLSAMAEVTMPLAAVLADIAIVLAFIAGVGAGVIGLHFAAKAFKWGQKAG